MQNGHQNWVRGLVFHLAGEHLLSVADDGDMRIWELGSGQCVRTFRAHEHFVTGIAWGRQVTISGLVNVVATCSVDKTVKIWRP